MWYGQLMVFWVAVMAGWGMGQDVRVYTSGWDFERGVMRGLRCDREAGALELAEKGAVVLPVIWVANTQEGTVSKVDTKTGRELGRYRTGPEKYTEYRRHLFIAEEKIPHRWFVVGPPPEWHGEYGVFRHPDLKEPLKYKIQLGILSYTTKENVIKEIERPYEVRPEPVAMAVDLERNVWVANRGDGTVVKVLDRLGCDFNGNGEVDTCEDTNRNGKIDGGELRAWGEDERVLGGYEVGAFDSEPTVLAVDADNHVWVGLHKEERFVKLHGASGEELQAVDVWGAPTWAMVDRHGYLWVKDNGITKIDTMTGEVAARFDVAGTCMTITREDYAWVSGAGVDGMLKVDLRNGRVIDAIERPMGTLCGAVTCDARGYLWAAYPEVNEVCRFDPADGYAEKSVAVGDGPVGLATGDDESVWVVSEGAGEVAKIDGESLEATKTCAVGSGAG